MQKTIIEAARMLGWLTCHFRPGRTSHGWRTAVAGDGKGFPDLVLVRHSVLFVEIKGRGGKLTREQELWRLCLTGAGATYHVVTPDNFDWFLENVVRFGNAKGGRKI